MRQITRIILAIYSLFIANSCITDEFRFDDLTIDEDWKMDLVVPIFRGDTEFRDFIYDWENPIPNLPGRKIVLDYSYKPDVTIPTQMILDESLIVDDYPFLVQGSYLLSDIKLIFKVSNSCPFPLNLKLQFYHYNKQGGGTPILSPPFEGNMENNEQKVYEVALNEQQTNEFNSGNRVSVSAWYVDPQGILSKKDTLSAHDQIKISMVIKGKARVEYEK